MSELQQAARVTVTDLRDGDLVDLTDHVAESSMVEVPQVNGAALAVGDPSRSRVEAVFIHVGHDQVILATDQVSLTLPLTATVSRLTPAL